MEPHGGVPMCNLNGLIIIKGLVYRPMGGSIVECPNTFHDGEGLLGCSNDKSKLILGWNIIKK
jgi:hypothetical protein